MKEDKFI